MHSYLIISVLAQQETILSAVNLAAPPSPRIVVLRGPAPSSFSVHNTVSVKPVGVVSLHLKGNPHEEEQNLKRQLFKLKGNILQVIPPEIKAGFMYPDP